MAENAKIAFPPTTAIAELSSIRAKTVPWYVWSSALAVTSTTVGLYWDISWHIGIGRDTFWTPAHLAIQFGAVLTGLCCAYLILHTTFASDAAAMDHSVRIWGFHGPLGAFIAAWGGFCMLTSAPFDNWWHNSFGLDVTILSPPHVVLILGIFVMGLGGLILTTSRMNLSAGENPDKLKWLLLYNGSLLLCLLLMLGYEYTGDQTLMHSAIYYRVLGMIVPVVLVGIGFSLYFQPRQSWVLCLHPSRTWYRSVFLCSFSLARWSSMLFSADRPFEVTHGKRWPAAPDSWPRVLP